MDKPTEACTCNGPEVLKCQRDCEAAPKHNPPAVAIHLADAQMLVALLDKHFGNDEGHDWGDEDAGAVADALAQAIDATKQAANVQKSSSLAAAPTETGTESSFLGTSPISDRSASDRAGDTTAHTPGPWRVVPASHGFVVEADCYDVAVVRNIGRHDNEANARLIAAAPDLLAAVKTFMALDRSFATVCDRHLDEMAKDNPLAAAVKFARAALAKATP